MGVVVSAAAVAVVGWWGGGGGVAVVWRVAGWLGGGSWRFAARPLLVAQLRLHGRIKGVPEARGGSAGDLVREL